MGLAMGAVSRGLPEGKEDAAAACLFLPVWLVCFRTGFISSLVGGGGGGRGLRPNART